MGFDSSEYGVCHSDELYLFWNPYWFGNYSLNKVTWGQRSAACNLCRYYCLGGCSNGSHTGQILGRLCLHR